MEFREFTNPEERNYDVYSHSTNNATYSKKTSNIYTEQLIDLIGFLEDVTEEDLQEQYGISMAEYLNPNAETIAKVTQKLNEFESGMHR